MLLQHDQKVYVDTTTTTITFRDDKHAKNGGLAGYNTVTLIYAPHGNAPGATFSVQNPANYVVGYDNKDNGLVATVTITSAHKVRSWIGRLFDVLTGKKPRAAIGSGTLSGSTSNAGGDSIAIDRVDVTIYPN